MSKQPLEVAMEYPLYQSKNGNYFIGETPTICGENKYALGILYNPCDSRRILYVNAITITNLSDKTLSAEFYLRATYRHGIKSNLVTCTNTSIYPPPVPAGCIIYYNSPMPVICNGIPIFSRLVPPQTTLVVDGSQIILGEKQSLGVFIGGLLPVSFDGLRFAFGWYEEETDC